LKFDETHIRGSLMKENLKHKIYYLQDLYSRYLPLKQRFKKENNNLSNEV